jgi:8-oxo-dGTP pyrophosphatase MutT (NUDIX family)
MDPFIVHPVSQDVEVRVTRAMPPISSSLDARIDAIWAQASARVDAGGAGSLFNGQVFSIDTIAPGHIHGHLTEYRRLVAQMEDHSLFSDLGIRSLAACGVLRCSGGILIGRRHEAAIYQPGMWQLCPAGSVDAGVRRAGGTMDYRAQLMIELREELGLSPEDFGAITPVCLVEHPGSHVCDLGLAAHTTLDTESILRSHRTGGNGEYDPLRIVPVPELPAFIEYAGAMLVPPAPLFLAHAGFIQHRDN